MFGWFKDPLKEKKSETEHYETVEEFLESELDITVEDFEELKLVHKNPKAFAFKTLGMNSESYNEFLQWKYSSLTERIEMCFKKVTAITHYYALVRVYKEKEYEEGADNIKHDKWKYTPPKDHLREAIDILNHALKAENVSQINIIRATVRLFYCLYTLTFRGMTPHQNAVEKLKSADVKNIESDVPPLPGIE